MSTAGFKWSAKAEDKIAPGLYVTVYWLGGRVERVKLTGKFHMDTRRVKYLRVEGWKQGVPFSIADPNSVSKSAKLSKVIPPDSLPKPRSAGKSRSPIPQRSRFSLIDENVDLY